VTRKDDFTSSSGFESVVKNIRSYSDVVWYSPPCTGGSAWQHLNYTKGEDTRRKIKEHRELFWKLWSSFENLFRHIEKIGARVVMELPDCCDYWKDERIQGFLNHTGFQVTTFDGRMHGLRAKHGEHKGPLYRKRGGWPAIEVS
jgi:hypothetical protein